MPLRAVVEFVLLAAIWGGSFMAMRVAAVGLGPWPTAALRVAVAAAVLLPLLLARGKGPVLWQHRRKLLLAGLLSAGLPFACFAWALLHIDTGLAAILNATVPLFGALIAWGWLGERPSGTRALGLALGFGGVTALVLGQMDGQVGFQPGTTRTQALLAIGACLLATLCYGTSANFAQRHLREVPALVNACGSLLSAGLLLTLPAATHWPATAPGWPAWLAVAVLGVVCTGLAYVMYFRLIARLGPARMMTVTFVIPVFALAYGAAFLGERITAWSLGCGAVVLLGTALSSGLLRWPGAAWRSPRSHP